MSKIIIGVSKGDSVISSVIKWFQLGNEYTHAFYCIPNTDLTNPEVIEAWHLPILKRGEVRTGKFYSQTNFKLYYVEATDEQVVNFYKYMIDKIGKHKYDYLGILGFVINSKNLQDKNSYFCSEILFEGLQSVGINLLNYTNANKVTPALLMRSPLLLEL